MAKLTQEEHDALAKAGEVFDAWWDEHGRFIDPDTDDVDWFDKRRGLAAYAFAAGIASTAKPN